MDRHLLCGRRRVVTGLAALTVRPVLAVEPSTYGLFVAGPAGGRTDRWAELLSPTISRGLGPKASVVRETIGGIDGVTGANQFEARVEPDGMTALLVPGSAMLSWLTGEWRARFEPTHWVPVWAGLGSAVLFSRTAPVAGQPFRVAASSPAGPELGLLLALDVLGVDARLVRPEPTQGAVLISPWSNLSPAMAMRAGLQPVLSFGVLTGPGRVGRDPNFPDVPTLAELTKDKAPPETLAALRAAAMAAQLDVGLVLPALTTGSAVALWRRACAGIGSEMPLSREIERMGARMPPADLLAACTSGMAVDGSTLLALRRWLATRYDWRPS